MLTFIYIICVKVLFCSTFRNYLLIISKEAVNKHLIKMIKYYNMSGLDVTPGCLISVGGFYNCEMLSIYKYGNLVIQPTHFTPADSQQ